MSDTIDLLQIKIENAKSKLPVETLNAIAAIDWKAGLVSLREKKGYNFEQLGDLELETELLLAGLVSPAEYPKELQNRMHISKAETDELVNEMNILVFNKIKEELIKNTERKRIFKKKKKLQEKTQLKKEEINTQNSNAPDIMIDKDDSTILKSAGIEVMKPVNPPVEKKVENKENILEKIEHPSPTSIVEPMRGKAETPHLGDIHPMLQQKILNSVQVPIVKTEHKIENIPQKNDPPAKAPEVTNTSYPPKKDPYRLSPDE